MHTIETYDKIEINFSFRKMHRKSKNEPLYNIYSRLLSYRYDIISVRVLSLTH